MFDRFTKGLMSALIVIIVVCIAWDIPTSNEEKAILGRFSRLTVDQDIWPIPLSYYCIFFPYLKRIQIYQCPLSYKK